MIRILITLISCSAVLLRDPMRAKYSKKIKSQERKLAKKEDFKKNMGEEVICFTPDFEDERLVPLIE
jgi:hypothetical protein